MYGKIFPGLQEEVGGKGRIHPRTDADMETAFWGYREVIYPKNVRKDISRSAGRSRRQRENTPKDRCRHGNSILGV
ncbi:hypothetical protein H6504_00110 [Candidatus Woesearchaeota archaeon]|nr:hypothetical protein [Candidatus Woesearchaeota archaeon]